MNRRIEVVSRKYYGGKVRSRGGERSKVGESRGTGCRSIKAERKRGGRFRESARSKAKKVEFSMSSQKSEGEV